ncbi:MAG: alpha/beta hydrolase [Chloroflexota bacterium]
MTLLELRNTRFISLLIVVGIGVWFHYRYGGLKIWYAKFFRISLTARRFYTTYEHVFRDIVFHPELQTRLDVYTPATGNNHPVLIFIHGGSWYKYQKELFATVAMRFLPEDMVVVVPDYTLHPHAKCQKMATEVAAASVWTLENIAQYGGDPQRVVISGHSAGAHLMMLAMADPQFLSQFGHTSTDFAGMIGLSGVYDIAAQDRFGLEIGASVTIMRAVVDGPDNFAQRSPIHHIHAELPPILLIHGANDRVVQPHMSQDLHAAIKNVGGQSQLKIYDQADHTNYVFEAVMKPKSELVIDMATFVKTATSTHLEVV